jgi:hypothetical protein
MLPKNYLKYYAFPVIGYEISKHDRLINTTKIPLEKSILIKCDYYKNYLVVYNLPYTKYLVEEFMTDEMKLRNYVLREELFKNKLMSQNFNTILDFHVESRIKMITEEKERENHILKKSVMSKEFSDVIKKIQKIRKNSKNPFFEKKIIQTDCITDFSEISVFENKKKIYNPSLKEYIINTAIDISSNITCPERKTEKYNIVGVCPVESNFYVAC